eukprot:TRINITY_DN12391_c1_g1_i9.p3 TRINITY_DN12391_c1_g1~~TRINITY_DN12391_c1_g1_i9.p3  ORF type:complete len:140 (-),score=5.31 TRINITY_DN12391_c1_g1_i9:951-1370(-)
MKHRRARMPVVTALVFMHDGCYGWMIQNLDPMLIIREVPIQPFQTSLFVVLLVQVAATIHLVELHVVKLARHILNGRFRVHPDGLTTIVKPRCHVPSLQIGSSTQAWTNHKEAARVNINLKIMTLTQGLSRAGSRSARI